MFYVYNRNIMSERLRYIHNDRVFVICGGICKIKRHCLGSFLVWKHLTHLGH